MFRKKDSVVVSDVSELLGFVSGFFILIILCLCLWVMRPWADVFFDSVIEWSFEVDENYREWVESVLCPGEHCVTDNG